MKKDILTIFLAVLLFYFSFSLKAMEKRRFENTSTIGVEQVLFPELLFKISFWLMPVEEEIFNTSLCKTLSEKYKQKPKYKFRRELNLYVDKYNKRFEEFYGEEPASENVWDIRESLDWVSDSAFKLGLNKFINYMNEIEDEACKSQIFQEEFQEVFNLLRDSMINGKLKLSQSEEDGLGINHLIRCFSNNLAHLGIKNCSIEKHDHRYGVRIIAVGNLTEKIFAQDELINLFTSDYSMKFISRSKNMRNLVTHLGVSSDFFSDDSEQRALKFFPNLKKLTITHGSLEDLGNNKIFENNNTNIETLEIRLDSKDEYKHIVNHKDSLPKSLKLLVIVYEKIELKDEILKNNKIWDLLPLQIESVRLKVAREKISIFRSECQKN